MGWFDEESNGHRIYWAEKRMVTVERSVKFNFEENMPDEGKLLEGEFDEVLVRGVLASKNNN